MNETKFELLNNMNYIGATFIILCGVVYTLAVLHIAKTEQRKVREHAKRLNCQMYNGVS